MNILIIGHGGHGKDAFCELLPKGITFTSSSRAACAAAVYPVLKDYFGYTSESECYEDRRNHRQAWKDLISEYNEEDPARLAKEIFGYSDVYNGMRSRREFDAGKAESLFKCIVYVDASQRLPDTIDPTFEMTQQDADVIIENNGTLEDLQKSVDTFVKNHMEITK